VKFGNAQRGGGCYSQALNKEPGNSMEYKMLWMRNAGDDVGVDFAIEIEGVVGAQQYMVDQEVIQRLENAVEPLHGVALSEAFHRHVWIISKVAILKHGKHPGNVIRLVPDDFPLYNQ
jgi:hypothetical protein